MAQDDVLQIRMGSPYIEAIGLRHVAETDKLACPCEIGGRSYTTPVLGLPAVFGADSLRSPLHKRIDVFRRLSRRKVRKNLTP